MLTYFQQTTSGNYAYLLCRDDADPDDVRCVETYSGPDAGEAARKAAENLNLAQCATVKAARQVIGATGRLALLRGRLR